MNSRLSYSTGSMGSWFSDLVGVNIDVNAGIQQFLNNIGTVFSRLGSEIQKIDWSQIGKNLGDWSHVVGNILTQINPVYLVWQGLSTNPITGHAFRELDKFTGGLLTSTTNVATLPSRVMRGDAISKKEIVEDALLGLKVASVVVSGGTSSAIVAASSSQLQRGYLGQTELGKAILGIGSATGLASLTGGSVTEALVKSGGSTALSATQTEVIKHSSLGQTGLGKIAIGAGFAAGGGELIGEGASQSLLSYGETTAKGEAGKLAPGGSQAATLLIDGAKKTDWDNVFSQGAPSVADGKSGFNFPGLDIASIPGALSNLISNINVSSPDINLNPSMPGIDLSMPDINAPSISMPEINIGQIPDLNFGGQKKKVVSRKRIQQRNKRGWLYQLEDGTEQLIEESDSDLWVYMVLIGVGLVA